MRLRWAALVLGLACTSTSAPGGEGDAGVSSDGFQDLGADVADVGAPDGTEPLDSGSSDGGDGAVDMSDIPGISCADQVPSSGFGREPGQSVAPFRLSRCDGSPWDFYDETYCAMDATVFIYAHAWAPPVIGMTMQIEAELNEHYAGAPVRIIQALVQMADYEAPDLDDCREWVERFGLSNPVVIDPTLVSGLYAGDGVPTTVVVDGTGNIVARLIGVDFDQIRGAVDATLAL